MDMPDEGIHLHSCRVASPDCATTNVRGLERREMKTNDWTANPDAVRQYNHLISKPNPKDARDICLGLLSMDPPRDFRDAINFALNEINDELFGME